MDRTNKAAIVQLYITTKSGAKNPMPTASGLGVFLKKHAITNNQKLRDWLVGSGYTLTKNGVFIAPFEPDPEPE